MWITDLSLNKDDRNILLSPTEWLNDNLVRASQKILKQRCGNVAGLDDPIMVAGSAYRHKNEKFIQVLNIPDRAHWVVVSNFHCNSNTVCLYDSLNMAPSSDLTYQISHLVGCDPAEPSLHINIMSVDRQTNGNDCGLYALANATSLVHGLDPCNMAYDQAQMRRHLLECIENNDLIVFPHVYRTVRRQIKRIVTLDLHCTCRTTYRKSDEMVLCSTCNKWLHVSCEGLTVTEFKALCADRNQDYKCNACLCRKDTALLALLLIGVINVHKFNLNYLLILNFVP